MSQEIESDLPLAFLAGHARRLQPGHPDPHARRGITGIQGSSMGGRLRHITNTAMSGTGIRTLAQISRPGWPGAGPRAALCGLMMQIAISEYQPFDRAWGACEHELDENNHLFLPAVLLVDGVEYDALELREHGVVARAAVVAGGWTVLASVPEGQEPAVELERADAAAAVAA